MDNGNSPIMEKARDIKCDLTDLGMLAVDAAQKKAAQLQQGASDMYQQGCAQVNGAKKSTETYIKNEPFKSVLIAGAIGLAIGYLLSRRGSK